MAYACSGCDARVTLVPYTERGVYMLKYTSSHVLSQGCMKLTCGNSSQCPVRTLYWSEAEGGWMQLVNWIPTAQELTQGLQESSESGALAPAPGKKGDLNGNGVVNIVDAQVAYGIACGQFELTSNSLGLYHAADVNADGFVDAADAFAIQYYVLRGVWGK